MFDDDDGYIEDPIERIDSNTKDLAEHVEEMKYKVGDMIKLKSGKIIEFVDASQCINEIVTETEYIPGRGGGSGVGGDGCDGPNTDFDNLNAE